MTGSVAAAEAAPRSEAARAGASRAEAGPLLTVSGLGVSYGRLRALEDVNLSVRTGELVALAGENGAGKTTLVRCIAGEVVPASGEVYFAGRRVTADQAAAVKLGIAVVWQDLALCDNLDIAANIMLGREPKRLLWSETRFHTAAASLLTSLQIPLKDTTRNVGSLSGAQRQLVAVARAMGRKPRLLALDEPTASLGVKEAAQVEELIMGLRGQGTTILLACHDIDQMFRLADRIVVLRQGRIVADLRTADTHPDDVVALISGQRVDSSARRQLTRLHGLTDRLVSADPSSSLPLILSALGSALGSERLCIHLVTDRTLYCAASLGFRPGQLDPWAKLPFGPTGGPVGLAAADERPDHRRQRPGRGGLAQLPRPGQDDQGGQLVVGPGARAERAQRRHHGVPRRARRAAAGRARPGHRLRGLRGQRHRARPAARPGDDQEPRARDDPGDAGDAGRDGPGQRGTRHRGPVAAPRPAGRRVRADHPAAGQPACWRAFAGPFGTDEASASASMRDMAETALSSTRPDGVARQLYSSRRQRVRAVAFVAAGGPTVLLASWRRVPPTKEETALLEDAAHSLRLALEREEAGHAHQEAAALRRSRELQRGFLSRLSHELRTPLTAIRGYASSLMQPDVTWDRESQQRFLDRIAVESARLGRLVDDLLDFSAIESGTMRLQWDWCDIRLVVEAAIDCLPPASAASVSLTCDPSLPVVWADHDRLEQVFVNLLNNAFGHNPPGTRVRVTAESVMAGQLTTDHAASEVVISVLDDGRGMPPELMTAPFEAARRPRPASASSGAPANASADGSPNGPASRSANGSRKSVMPGSGCPSPGASCRRTAAGSSWSRCPRAPASGCTCPWRRRPVTAAGWPDRSAE